MIDVAMRKKNLYLIAVSIAMLLILMGTAAAETYNVQTVQFDQTNLGSYKFIELNGYRQMVGYGTDLDKSVVDEANMGNAIFDVDLLKNGYAAKVLIDTGDEYIVATGDGIELNEGYVVNIQQIDIDGNKALIELTKDGKVVDTDVLQIGDSGAVYLYDQIQNFGYYKVPIIIVHIVNVRRDTGTNVAIFDGIFQISEFLTSVDRSIPIVVDETIIEEPIASTPIVADETIVEEPDVPTPNSKFNPESNQKDVTNNADNTNFGFFFIIAIALLLIVIVGKKRTTNKQNKTRAPSSTTGKSSTVPTITTAFGYKGATIKYKVKVENPTSEPMADIKVNLYVPDVFLASESTKSIAMLKPSESKTVTFEIRPTGECGDCQVSGKVIFYDYSTKLTSEVEIPPKNLSIVCPMLRGKDISDSEWHSAISNLVKTEESTKDIDMPAKTLFEMTSRIVKDMNMHQLKPEMTDNPQLFNGVSRFYGEGIKNLKYAAQIEVVGGAKKSRLILKTWAEKEEALTGFYHGLLDEIEKRVHVKEYIDDSTVQNFYHYGDNIGTQVKDSIVQRSNIGTAQVENKCSECGTVAEGNGKFCNECGTKL
ncbi:MAG: hypothetical protein KAH86_01840 [Methanosarcinales archaeon]|nr:hypothetical protein [Methanosarcinales archaeon]